MNFRNPKLVALNSPNDNKKIIQADLKENDIHRQMHISSVKPSSSYLGSGTSALNLSVNANTASEQKLLNQQQQPMSAQAVRSISTKNGDGPSFGVLMQGKSQGQENQSLHLSQGGQIIGSTLNGKMLKSKSLQKHSRIQIPSNNLRSTKNLQTIQKGNEIKDQENESNGGVLQISNSNNKGHNLQINMSSSSTKAVSVPEQDNDKKQQIANIRLPKLQAPLSGKSKEQGNFVDIHMTEQEQQDEKKGGEKKKDPDLERIKDRIKIYKNSTISNFQLQVRSGSPPQESHGNTTKNNDEPTKISGGTQKYFRSNTPNQTGTVTSLKPAVSTLQFQINQGNSTSQTQFMNSGSAFTTKHLPKKPSISNLQQKQLRMIEKAQNNNNSNPTNMPVVGQGNPLNNSKLKEELGGDLSKKDDTHFINSYAHRSKAGCNYQGPKKNQDNFIIHPNLNKLPNRYLFSVCDGHGVLGHEVSGFIRNNYPKILENLLAKDLNCLDQEYISSCFKLSYLQLSQKLLESKIDCTFSGSTFVSVLIIDDKIWCANTGDSRAIICKQSKALWNAEYLSMDHKADLPEEKQRIEAAGGRVDSYRDFNGDPLGPARVWMKFDDIPGLAMSRSFGDLIAAQCGVICEPDIKHFLIEDDDKFIVIASDGVWEFLNNRQVMIHVMPFYIRMQPDMACQKLIKESTANWKQHDEVVDDITAISIFFNKNKPKRINQEANLNGGESLGDQFEEAIDFAHNFKKIQEEYGLDDKVGETLLEGSDNGSIGNKFGSSQGGKQVEEKKNGNSSKSNVIKLTSQKKEKEEENHIIIETNETKENSPAISTNKIKENEAKNDQLHIKKSESDKKGNRKVEDAKEKKKSEKEKIQKLQDQSDSDSDYSKDFELDKEREQQQSNNKFKKEQKDLSSSQLSKTKQNLKGEEQEQQKVKEDEDDDDQFFRNL